MKLPIAVFPFFLILINLLYAGDLEDSFLHPEEQYHPETWFHLIGGNVSREALETDLDAVQSAGFRGIHLFHGKGGKWPGVEPQIECLSEEWDGLIEFIGQETERQNLEFTMQNCPGWAMSGGPWISPQNAMRHLIWSRIDVNVVEGKPTQLQLPMPTPSKEDWRDYQDVAVLAFPTPVADSAHPLIPSSIGSNFGDIPWMQVLSSGLEDPVRIQEEDGSVWLEVEFEEAVALRSIELSPTEHFADRWSFDPGITVTLEAIKDGTREFVGKREIPRGNWQDRQSEHHVSLAFSDFRAKRFRITFEHAHSMVFSYMRLIAEARTNDWKAQAGYVLRSLERQPAPVQDPQAWVDRDSIVDLTDSMAADGSLDLSLSAGKWTVLRFGHVNTGVKNKPAPPEATGFECNKLSTIGADQHFDGYIGRLAANEGVIEGKLDGVLIDSWECYTQTWTYEMEQEFLNKRGYTLRSWLPALAGWVVDDHVKSERFMRDWRATISDLLVDEYFGRMAEHAHANGLSITFETALGDVSPGDILQHFSKADVPMCEMWQPNDPHWGGLETKPIAPTVSSARLYGKPLIAAEAFTNVGLKWNEHPYMLKNQADRHFTLGINHMVFHTYTHNPRIDLVPGTSFGGRIGTPFIRGQTWWKYMPLFTDYLARCHSLLQRGKSVSDVLWYLGDDLDHKPRQDSAFPDGYQFDYLNHDALVNRISVQNGKLVTEDGTSWKLIWLAPEQCSRLSIGTLVRLKTLIEKGAMVVGAPPQLNASLEGDDEQRWRVLCNEIWGECPEPEGKHEFGKGRIVWGGNIDHYLREFGIRPDLKADRTLNWCHRVLDGGKKNVYFLAADRDDAIREKIRFRALGKPTFWDPMTGERSEVAGYSVEEGCTILPIALNPAESIFVVFEESHSTPMFERVTLNGEEVFTSEHLHYSGDGEPYPAFGLDSEDEVQPWFSPSDPVFEFKDQQLIVWKDGELELSASDESVFTIHSSSTGVMGLVDQPWTLEFEKDWDTLEQVKLERLCGWSDLDHPESKMYSGTASYQTRVRLNETNDSQRVMLDLGRVENIAEVWLNGKHVGTKWAPPFRFDITAYLSGNPNGELLEVKVTNTWRNRLIFDEGKDLGERKTWTKHAPPADADVSPAGLVGDVKIRIGNAYDLSQLSMRTLK